MTRPAATRTARMSRDDTPWASAGIKIRSPAASGPMRARSWLMTLIICGASWSRIGNNLARSAADGRGERGHGGRIDLIHQSVVIDLEQPDRALVEELAQILQLLRVVPPPRRGVPAHRLRTARYCLGDPALASIRNRTGVGAIRKVNT
jgi:hypothetical protein